MKRTTFILLLLVALTGITTNIFAQRSIGGRSLVLDDNAGNSITINTINRSILIGTNSPGVFDPFNSAMFFVNGLGPAGVNPALTSPRGVLLAPMSNAQRNSIVNPANGLLVYNTTTNTYDVFAGGAWAAISGWTMVGNNVAPPGGGTQLGQNFLGSLNNMDVVIATNVGLAGSGNGERVRVTGAGQVGFSAMNSPFFPATDFNVDGTNGVSNVRLNSLGGAPLMAPPLNLLADGITIAGGAGDLIKYDVATVVGSVAWLRTGNNIVDGNNLFGTVAGSATTDVQMQTNGVNAMFISGTNQRVGIGNSAPAQTLHVTGTFTSTGNSTVGTTAGTTNSFGNGGAGTVNNVGNGATTNNVGLGAFANNFGNSTLTNNFGNSAPTNNFGNSATTNNLGTTGAPANNIGLLGATNTVAGTTNINNSVNAATNIATGTSSGNVNIGNNGNPSGAITISSGNLAGGNVTINTVDNAGVGSDLVLNGIELVNPIGGNLLWLTGANEVRQSAPNTNANQGLTWQAEAVDGGAIRVRLGARASDALGTNALLENRASYLGGFQYRLADNAGNTYLAVNDAGNTTQIGYAGGTANTMTGSSNTITATGANALSSASATATTTAGDLTLTVPGAASGNDLRFVGVDNVPFTGTMLWLDAGNNVRVSNPAALVEQGLTWQLEASGLKIRLGARATDALGTNNLLENRVVYLGGFQHRYADNAGNTYLAMNDAANTTQLGFAGGTANTVTGTTNTMTASAAGGNTINATGGPNAITGQTGNTITATTGNNAITASIGQNIITGQTGNSLIANTLNNTITALATNAITATTGFNNLVANSAAMGNNLVANGAGGANTLTANGVGGINQINAIGAGGTNTIGSQAGNTMTAITGNNQLTANGGNNQMLASGGNIIQANGAAGNLMNSTTTGNNTIQTTGTGANVISSATSNAMVAATQTAITSNNGNTTITTNSGDLILDVDGGVNRDIVMINVDAAVPANTDRSLFLNAANEVNTRTFSALADQGLQYDATAFMLGANANGVNPITSNRFVSTTTGTLTFNNGAANNYIAIGTSAANTLALGNAANTFSLTSTGLNVSTTGVISDAGGNVEIADNTVPTLDNNFSLGTDAVRWSEAYINGASVHIGPSGGEAGNTEMNLGYAANVGTVNVDGGTAELSIDRTAANLMSFNPNGAGAAEATIGMTGLTLNTAGGTDLLLSEAGLDRSNAADQTFLFNNSGAGRLDVSHKGHVFPSATGLYDLGSPALVWNNIYANNLFLPPMTPGSVLFIGAGGQMTQDNANFFWDNVNNRLGLGNAAPDAQLHVTGTTHLVGTVNIDNLLTVTAGGAIINGGATINGGGVVNNSLTVNLALPATNQDYLLTVPTNAGGATGIRQFSELPYPGYGRVQMRATAANTNLTVGTDYVLICTNGAGINVALPAAAGNSGKTFIVKSRGAGNVTLTPAGASLIDGAAAHVIVGGGNQTRSIVCDGTDWFIIGN